MSVVLLEDGTAQIVRYKDTTVSVRAEKDCTRISISPGKIVLEHIHGEDMPFFSTNSKPNCILMIQTAVNELELEPEDLFTADDLYEMYGPEEHYTR